MRKFLGVIGGMGPLATADFLARLVQKSNVATDQEHIPIIVYGDCTVPDRSSHVLGLGPSPLPKLLDGVKFLNDSGVGAICMPCNSAHIWFDEMRQASRVPIIHIVEATAAQIRHKHPSATTVGVLSTLGVCRMNIYSNPLRSMGFTVLVPTDEEFTSLISPGIADVKANRIRDAETRLESAALTLCERGADVIALGCTEIPIGLQRQLASQSNLYVDSTEALALSVINIFRNLKTADGN